MKFNLVLFVFLVGCGQLLGQSQLDIQGNVGSTDTVARVIVNYSGFRNITGLYVSSQPANGFGIGGQFIGGHYGVFGKSSSGVGVFGESIADIGVTGASTSGAGVFGISSTNDGMSGASTSKFGVVGRSTLSVGVVGKSNNTGSFDFDAQGVGMDYGSTSSRRWKTNIINISAPLDKISKLRGVYFDWDEAHGGQHDIGFIAEEVGAIFPEIVGFEANGIDATSMDYSKMTPLLVETANAMRKEYSEKFQLLEQKIKTQDSQIEALKGELLKHRFTSYDHSQQTKVDNEPSKGKRRVTRFRG